MQVQNLIIMLNYQNFVIAQLRSPHKWLLSKLENLNLVGFSYEEGRCSSSLPAQEHPSGVVTMPCALLRN